MCLPKKDEKFFYYGVQTLTRTPKSPKEPKKKGKKHLINPKKCYKSTRYQRLRLEYWIKK